MLLVQSQTFKLPVLSRLAGSIIPIFSESRLVRFKRSHAELGVQICGGNLCGIFVETLDDDSPAKGPDGLSPGDLILEVHRCLPVV